MQNGNANNMFDLRTAKAYRPLASVDASSSHLATTNCVSEHDYVMKHLSRPSKKTDTAMGTVLATMTAPLVETWGSARVQNGISPKRGVAAYAIRADPAHLASNQAYI